MTQTKKQYRKAPLYRQLFAMFYDSLLLMAILFIATAILLVFNHGEAITTEQSPFYSIYLLLIVFFFYAWFWRKSGQTLGMKVWKIQIIHESGYLPSWQHSFLRLSTALLSIACLGLGYWWFIPFKYTWHDRISQTMIIDLRPEKKV